MMLAPLTLPSVVHAGVIASSVDLPLSGFFYDSVTQENVNFSSTLHVMTQVKNGGLTRIEANVADSSGAGQTSGGLYKITGADRVIPGNPIIPGNPVIPMTFTLSNIPGNPIIPGNPVIPPNPVDLPLLLNLQFDSSGNLLPGGTDGGSSVSVGSINN
jgi:hypothetical protein